MDISPLFDLRLRTPRLELHLPTRPWQPSFAIEIESLGTCLPLFGVSPV